MWLCISSWFSPDFYYYFSFLLVTIALGTLVRCLLQPMGSHILQAALGLLRATERQNVVCRRWKFCSRILKIHVWHCWPTELHHSQLATVLFTCSWAEYCAPQCPSILLFLPLCFQTVSSSQLKEGKIAKRTQRGSTTGIMGEILVNSPQVNQCGSLIQSPKEQQFPPTQRKQSYIVDGTTGTVMRNRHHPPFSDFSTLTWKVPSTTDSQELIWSYHQQWQRGKETTPTGLINSRRRKENENKDAEKKNCCFMFCCLHYLPRKIPLLSFESLDVLLDFVRYELLT